MKIFYTTDIHGYVYPYYYHDNQEKEMGLAKIASYINQHRDQDTIYIDNGDVLEGSQLLDYFYESNKKVHPMIQAMKLANVDYVNIGNHDFNYGMEVLTDYLSNFKCITCNILYHGEHLGRSYIHQSSDGKKVAIIGVCTHYIVNWEKPENLKGVEVIDAFKSLKVEVEKIKDQVDYVVAVYHGGFEKDLHNGTMIDQDTGENQGHKMLMEIDGIDVLLTGHQHRIISENINDTWVIQSGMAGECFACVDISDNIKASLLKADAKADEKIINSLQELENETQNWLDEAIAHLDEDLLIQDGFQARLHKHKLVSLLNQVQLHYSGADFSAIALFNDAYGFSKDFNMRELTSTYVYPNVLHIMETDTIQLKLFLEKCAEYFCIVDDQIQVNPSYYEVKKQHYNYDMVDGLSYTIKVSNPIGQRVISMKQNGEDLDPNKKYTIVMNNYRSSGGGDFTMVKQMKLVRSVEQSMVKLVYEYFKSNPHVVINHQDNIQVIK